ncbi:MAG: bifunctional diguanylate cyclase/phosphodiesterase [Comamonadaceae bacterium]|nr:MAG: bifunctional diguanylate cyclase/phosphodiesterase [Comamonadaceae bacterium]
MPHHELAGHFKVRDGLVVWADQDAHELLGYPIGALADMMAADVFASPAECADDALSVPALGDVNRLAVRLRTRHQAELVVDMHGERMDDHCTLWTVRRAAGGLRRARVEALARHDALTGLSRRVATQEEMQRSRHRPHTAGAVLAVCFLDIDGFREVNGQVGPAGGDAVLCEVARRLRGALPTGAMVARVGGDEFALLLWRADAADCSAFLQQLLARLAHPYRWNDQPVRLRFNVGVALAGADAQPAEVLLQQARQAVFLAKQAGDEICFFDAARALEAREAVGMRQRMRLALERQEFVLAYQPKVDMHRGRVVGLEALIRWQHPERGLLQPGAFIPLVEDHALVEQLGDWAIAESLRQASAWLTQGVPVSISVNVSPRALLQPDFVERLAAHLARHPQLGAGVLELEILETTAIQDLKTVSGFIARCERLGVPVVLDDFGTGYSSLTYLRELPASGLKLDRSFVCGILHSEADRAIVRGILVMADGLGRRVVAEGVESVAHGEALLALGCTLGQGFGIAKPLPPEQVTDWIAAFERAPPWGRG